jgi:DNA-binding protein YbaB
VMEIRLDPACVYKNEVEMLEDLIVAAVSQAQAKARQVYEEEMKKAAGGLPMQIPGLF